MEQTEISIKRWLQKTASFAIAGIFVILFFGLVTPVEAGNQQITFQGKLTNSSGNTVSDGTYYVKLTIYDAATGGSCQYTASSTCSTVTSTPVAVANGIFSINLGDTSAALAAISPTLFNNSALYLGVTVCSGAGTGCDSEMTPRKRITAAPYAFNADYLSGLATSTIGGVGSYVPVTDSSGNLKITNSLLIATTTAGQFGVGTTTIPSGVKAFIDSTTASDKLLVIRANSSQTGNLQEWQNNSGTALVAVNSSGNISTSGTLATFGNATIGGHLYPSSDNLYDIGASSTQWRYGNFQGGVLVANGSTTSTLTRNSLVMGQANSENLGGGVFSVDSSGNVNTSGSIYINGGDDANLFRINNAVRVDSDNVKILFDESNAGYEVGIGTSNPSEKLTVIGNVASANGSTTSTLTQNSLTLGQTSSKGVGTFYVDSSGNTSASGSLRTFANVTSSGHIYPAASNAVDLGALNTAFRNIYASSSINVGSSANSSTFMGNYLALTSGVSSTVLNASSLILGSGTNYSSGMFNIDSNGNVAVSGTLQVFGNSTFGDSDAAGGDTARIFGSLAMGSAPTGNAQLFLKASSTTAVPLLIQDSNGNTISKMASSSAEAIVNGAQTTLNGFSFLTLGDASGLPGALSIRATANTTGAILFYRNATAIGGQLSSDSLIIGSGASTTTLSNISLILNQTSGYNQGKFNIDSNGNSSVSGTTRIFGGATTGGLLISADNSTTTFYSYAPNAAGSAGFVFNSDITSTTIGTALDRVLFAVQSRSVNKFLVSGDGNVYATAGFNANSTEYGIGDVAEYVNLVSGEEVEPGDVLVVDKIYFNQYKKSNTAYTKEVAGVVSETGAFIMGAAGIGRAPLALAGLVKVKVSDENGPVAVGDYLTTASKPGYAMRFDADAGISAGLVGMALEPLELGDGKITILVNKGLVVGNSVAGSELTVSQNGSGQVVWGNDFNLHLLGRSILDVLSIKSQDEKWMIDEDGYLVVKVKTQQGDKELYGLQSGQDKEVVFSGSSQLDNGVKKIELPAIDKEIVDINAPIKVSVTLTGEANGVFVTEKSYEGFTVKELNGGTSDATFDWLVIAKRRAVGDEAVVVEVEEENNVGVVNEEAPPEDITAPEVSETPVEPALETAEDDSSDVETPPVNEEDNIDSVDDDEILPAENAVESAVSSEEVPALDVSEEVAVPAPTEGASL